MVTVPITKEMIEQARGLVVEGSLRPRSSYENKTNEDLEEIIRFQTKLRNYGSVDVRDDVELHVCKGILVEDRGYSWCDIELLWYGAIMECRHNGMDYLFRSSETVDY